MHTIGNTTFVSYMNRPIEEVAEKSNEIATLRELIRECERAIEMIQQGLTCPMSKLDVASYPKPFGCDFIIGNFGVMDLRPRYENR
jgi:hypothetical protein